MGIETLSPSNYQPVLLWKTRERLSGSLMGVLSIYQIINILLTVEISSTRPTAFYAMHQIVLPIDLPVFSSDSQISPSHIKKSV